jgi:hypothetical protein
LTDDQTEVPAENEIVTPRPKPTMPSALTHESDRAIRPGFRNPPTPKSLSQQKKKKKK